MAMMLISPRGCTRGPHGPQTVGNEGAVGGVLTRSSSADCDSRKARVWGSAPVDTEQLIDELGLPLAGSDGGPPRFGCGISDREVARADHLRPQRPFDSHRAHHLKSS